MILVFFFFFFPPRLGLLISFALAPFYSLFLSFFLFCFFLTFTYFWESVSQGGAEREGDTESEGGSRLWAVSTEPDAGLEPTNLKITAWAEVGRSTDWATQAPWVRLVSLFLKQRVTVISLGTGIFSSWRVIVALLNNVGIGVPAQPEVCMKFDFPKT